MGARPLLQATPLRGYTAMDITNARLYENILNLKHETSISLKNSMNLLRLSRRTFVQCLADKFRLFVIQAQCDITISQAIAYIERFF